MTATGLGKRLGARLDRLRTSIRRRVRPATSSSTLLRRRVLERVRELGLKYSDGNSDLLGYTYHPIPFEGFENVKTHREECDSRVDAILANLRLEPGDVVLDVGANVGFFAFSLARHGAIVECYEPESASFEIGAALSKLHSCDVLFINKELSVGNLKLLRDRYRAALVLSVFHWIVKQNGEADAAEILREIHRRSQVLFFEVPSTSGDGMCEVPAFQGAGGAESYLRRILPLAAIELVNHDDRWGGRSLYKVTHRRRET